MESYRWYDAYKELHELLPILTFQHGELHSPIPFCTVFFGSMYPVCLEMDLNYLISTSHG